MSHLSDYVANNWQQSAKRDLHGLLLLESKPSDDSDEALKISLLAEQKTIEAEFKAGDFPCIPGDELERQWAKAESTDQRPTADAYICLDDLHDCFQLLECKYRIKTGTGAPTEKKVRNLYPQFVDKFTSSRTILEGEGAQVKGAEILVFNADAADDLRDSLESYCIEADRPVFAVVSSSTLKSHLHLPPTPSSLPTPTP